MSEAADGMRDPARDHALTFVADWAKRYGKDPHGEEAEELYQQVYLDVCEAMDAWR